MYIFLTLILMQPHTSVNRNDCNSTLFGTKIYCRSRGIRTPKPHTVNFSTFREIIQDYEIASNRSIELCVNDIETKETHVLNTFTYRTYKKKNEKEN